MSEYLKKVAQHLDEESHRVESYLHPSTLAPLIIKIEEILMVNLKQSILKLVEIFINNNAAIKATRNTKKSADIVSSIL
ncbi:unnamed protein product [Rotaria sordida]|uniref:Cullin N-terminal domain-containing protein n=1 Tax=Rotaria sordida TaxID=392033 RepID=A0A816CAK0_9BILA|nr:unnamed protein product [Rotaria sordida]CAF1617896.1 unnamed protein product [Rotaria sordida]